MRVTSILLVVLATSLAAQTVAPPPAEFEVASIRRSADVTTRMVSPLVGQFLPGGIWRARDVTIATLISALYPDPARWQIVGGPDWIRQEFYDIEARAPAAASAAEVRAMARTLLADRLGLQVHTETRQLSATVLTLPKGRRLGPGFTKPAVDCAGFRAGGERPPDSTRQPYADRLPCAAIVMPTSDKTLKVPGANLRLSAGDATLTEIAPLLGSTLGRPVLDQTGLTERFDIELQFSSSRLNATAGTADIGPVLRTAISEQLALEMRDTRAPIEVLVIDKVERPTAN